MSTGSKNIGIIILAAGASSRMGKPKQLLPYHYRSMLQHMVDIATAVDSGPVLVVLGSNAELIKNELSQGKFKIVYNESWQQGLASSIKTAVQELEFLSAGSEAAIILASDQPLISVLVLKEIISSYRASGKPIIASSYAGTVGIPALFSAGIFAELKQLQGDKGAKSVIQKDSARVALVDFADGAIDIDTESDYFHLMQNGSA